MALLAYFMTWTTYGTWLPGDERGSTTHAREGRGPRPLGVRPGLERSAAESLKHDAVVLCDARRDAVERAIRRCADEKAWRIFALNVRTNHVHIVMAAPGEPRRLMAACKAAATKELRLAGMVGEATTVWTRHGSTRRIHTDASLQAAVRYTSEQDHAFDPRQR